MNFSGNSAELTSAPYAFKPGINDDVNLLRVEFTTNPTSEFLGFIFEKNGSECTYPLWTTTLEKCASNVATYNPQHKKDQPKYGYVKGTNITAQESFDIANRVFMGRVFNILKETCGFEGEINAKSKEDFISQVNKILKNKKPVRLLLFYDEANYLKVPKSNYRKIVESMTTDIADSKLAIEPDDKMVKSGTNVSEPTMNGSNNVDTYDFSPSGNEATNGDLPF